MSAVLSRLISEDTDQFITDYKNDSCSTFTFATNEFQSVFVRVHPNIPGQYITNIPA